MRYGGSALSSSCSRFSLQTPDLLLSSQQVRAWCTLNNLTRDAATAFWGCWRLPAAISPLASFIRQSKPGETASGRLQSQAAVSFPVFFFSMDAWWVSQGLVKPEVSRLLFRCSILSALHKRYWLNEWMIQLRQATVFLSSLGFSSLKWNSNSTYPIYK